MMAPKSIQLNTDNINRQYEGVLINLKRNSIVKKTTQTVWIRKNGEVKSAEQRGVKVEFNEIFASNLQILFQWFAVYIGNDSTANATQARIVKNVDIK